MITSQLRHNPIFNPWNKNAIIDSLIKSRNLFEVQTIECGPNVVSLDLDHTGNFLLVGLMNGTVFLEGITDPNMGLLEHDSHIDVSRSVLKRVQWNPGEDQIYTALDSALHLVDPVGRGVIEKFTFDMSPSWSEWNPNDGAIIAVSGSKSQARLVDVRVGSSVQTIILGNLTRVTSHRANTCVWSNLDFNCLVLGDNDGCIHVYDTRRSNKPLAYAHEQIGQITHMSYTADNMSIITSSGPRNHLTQWYFDKCSLRPISDKFRKPPKEEEEIYDNCDENISKKQRADPGPSVSRVKQLDKSEKRDQKERRRKIRRKQQDLIVSHDLYLQCQFYITESHIFCPAAMNKSKLKQFYVYDLDSGLRIKTVKSDDITSRGVFAVSGLLSESIALYTGGRGGLKVWAMDEDHQRKMDEKAREYHVTRWDSDED